MHAKGSTACSSFVFWNWVLIIPLGSKPLVLVHSFRKLGNFIILFSDVAINLKYFPRPYGSFEM